MNVKEIQESITQVNGHLIETGCFPDGWLSNYLSMVDESKRMHTRHTWPKQLFYFWHYASTHLVLRYRVWKGGAGRTNKDSELGLNRIHLETEAYLWKSLTALPDWRVTQSHSTSEGAMNNAERNLVELCFGDCSPLDELTEGTSFRDWKNAYEDCLVRIQEQCILKDNWPKWLCVAIHFAAFYVDLYQKQDIDLINSSEHQEAASSGIGEVTSELSRIIHNRRVTQLIKLWLCSASADRDSSGLPVLGVTRPRTGQLISVRTSSELFLQTCTS